MRLTIWKPFEAGPFLYYRMKTWSIDQMKGFFLNTMHGELHFSILRSFTLTYIYIYIYIYIYAQHCAPCFYPNFVGVSSTLLESYMTHPRWGAPKFERSWSRNSSNRLIIYSAIRLQCKKQKLLLPSHTSHALSQVYIHFTNISPWRG